MGMRSGCDANAFLNLWNGQSNGSREWIKILLNIYGGFFTKAAKTHGQMDMHRRTSQPADDWAQGIKREWRSARREMGNIQRPEAVGKKIEINVSGLVPIPSYMRFYTPNIIIHFWLLCCCCRLASVVDARASLTHIQMWGRMGMGCAMATATAATSDHQSRNDYDMLGWIFRASPEHAINL